MPRSSVPLRIVLCDGEERVRSALAQRLRARGFEVWEAGDALRASRLCQEQDPDVVMVDLPEPGPARERVLRVFQRASPDVPILVTTSHVAPDPEEVGEARIFAVLEKPCGTDEVIEHVEAAARTWAQRSGVGPAGGSPPARRVAHGLGAWLWGSHGLRPVVLALGAVLFAGLLLAPPPDSLERLAAAKKTGDPARDAMRGYPGYERLPVGRSVSEAYHLRSGRFVTPLSGHGPGGSGAPSDTARAALVSIGVLVVTALFWATGALPMGFTALLAVVLLVLGGVFSPAAAPRILARDSVLFVFGVLALAQGVSATGLDRRVGLWLLGPMRSAPRYLFLFLPAFACLAAFLWSFALVAFLAPVLLLAYLGAVRAAGRSQDRALVTMLLLSLCFTANLAASGSPAAGGHNAVMLGLLADYGHAPTFLQWMGYAFPFVPVVTLAVGLYFYLALGRRVRLPDPGLAAAAARERQKLGPLSRAELGAAVILGGVFVLWCTTADRLGLGGPALIGLVLMAALRLMGWQHVGRIAWDVVALYAAASGLGSALVHTGAAPWMAGQLTAALPAALGGGDGLVLGSGLVATALTNLIGDGATVATVGSVAVSAAHSGGADPWRVGLATAMAASFTNILVIASPSNALVYALARDPASGEQLITTRSFAWHGLIVTAIAFAVLALWSVLGYWAWIGGGSWVPIT